MSGYKMEFYQAMLQAVKQTFENMAFVEVTEQAAECELQTPAEMAWASILIHDPQQGEVRLALPRTLLVELTAGMFGIEADEVTGEQQDDILAELLNTLAGLFMTNLLPDDQAYQLGLPEHGEGEFSAADEVSVTWNLQVEQNPLILVASGASLVDEAK